MEASNFINKPFKTKLLMIFTALVATLYLLKGVDGETKSNCSLIVEKVGCFSGTQSRLQKELLISDREQGSLHKIEWYNYPEYLKGLVCRCAGAARARKLPMFGIRFWGECWGFKNSIDAVKKLRSSKHCYTTKFTSPCLKSTNLYCTGTLHTAYIYKNVAIKDPLNGGYSDWSPWSKCTKSCGGGVTIRARTCTNPTPQSGGRDCSSLGKPEAQKACNEGSCDVFPFQDKNCGKVSLKVFGGYDKVTLNASVPFTPTLQFCRVLYPKLARFNDFYKIEVWMVIYGTNKNHYNGSAGIIFNSKDIDTFQMISLYQDKDDKFCYSAATHRNGVTSFAEHSAFNCMQSRDRMRYNWIKLVLKVSRHGASLTANGQYIVKVKNALPLKGRGGVLVRRGIGNFAFFTGYKI